MTDASKITQISNFDDSQLDWAKVDGLMPVIVQDRHCARVLMLGYMNAEALALTLASKQVTFFSRTKIAYGRKAKAQGIIYS